MNFGQGRKVWGRLDFRPHFLLLCYMSGEINAVLQDENTKTTQKGLMATCSTRHVDLTLARASIKMKGLLRVDDVGQPYAKSLPAT